MILFFFVSRTPQLNAQKDCETALTDAQNMYAIGNFDNTIRQLLPCLDAGFSDGQKVYGYRLLALSYLAMDEFDEARDAIQQLLVLSPRYKYDPVRDPLPFTRILFELGPSNQDIFDFWLPFIGKDGVKIVVGSPLLWTGPHDPRTGSRALEPTARNGKSIAIYNGIRHFSDKPSIPMTTPHYMLPRNSFTSLFEARVAYKLSEFLLPKSQVKIYTSYNVKSFDDNFILIGGPSANTITAKFINKLDYKFRFKFLLRKKGPTAEGPLVHKVDSSQVTGIGDAANSYLHMVKYRPENKSASGRDGAIIIKSFNPYFPDKTILILAGFEEHGTLAAIDILQTSFAAIKEINKLYQRGGRRSTIEMVVATSVKDKKPTDSRILPESYQR